MPAIGSVGAKRNQLCSAARGDIIVHWDDDDYSAPRRVEDQVNRLVGSGLAATGYRSMKFTDGSRWWLYVGSPMYALGTSLCYLRSWWLRHPFRDMNVGEDNEFVSAAKAERQLTVADADGLMWASIHRKNTSPRQLCGSNWKEIAPCCR